MGAEIDKNLIMEYVSSVKESYPAKKMLLLNTILFNDYIKKTHIILLAAGITILLNKDNLSGILIYTIYLFIIPAFIKGKS